MQHLHDLARLRDLIDLVDACSIYPKPLHKHSRGDTMEAAEQMERERELGTIAHNVFGGCLCSPGVGEYLEGAFCFKRKQPDLAYKLFRVAVYGKCTEDGCGQEAMAYMRKA